MYQLISHFSLLNYNTFGISAVARHFLTIESPEDLISFFAENNEMRNEKMLLLGAGSNLLFVNDFEGLVIHPCIDGIRLINENKYLVEIEVGAGVRWDSFVAWCIEKGWGGVENLSLIPGNTGAVPVQNIGAYGVEAASVISSVKGIDINSLEPKTLTRKDCKFGYRSSIFKNQLKEQFMVTHVVFRLSKHPEFQLHYGGLENEVSKFGEKNLQNIRSAVIAIRESKLPDPSKLGNAGSFFKNPVVSELFAKTLKDLYPDIPLYPVGTGSVKIAAGWLIEKAGWKGRSYGNAAIHDKQALVIINKGGASGKEIFRLSEMVAEDVLLKFNIELEHEVQVIDGNN
jgi:UDP-N-acetylmuramate dehydrogenase